MMRAWSVSLGSLALLGLLIASCGGTTVVPGGTGGSGGGGGPQCTDSGGCEGGKYCGGTDDGACGPLTRVCQVYPASCSEGIMRTVCGCDGKTHAIDACPGATYLQIDPRPTSCPPAPGTIGCGEGACMVDTQYCSEGPKEVKCVDLPVGCTGAMATCACVKAAMPSGCGCNDEASGGVRFSECGL